MKPDPLDPYAEIRARPELALFTVLENALSRMVDVLMATNPELCIYPPRPPGKKAIQADRLIGRVADLQEALRRYRSCSGNEQGSVSTAVETPSSGTDPKK